MTTRKQGIGASMPDIVAILGMGAVLTVANEVGWMDKIMAYPMILALVCYWLGRTVSGFQLVRMGDGRPDATEQGR